MIDSDHGGHSASRRAPLPPVTTQWASPDVADPGAVGPMLPPFHNPSLDTLAGAGASPVEREESLPVEPQPLEEMTASVDVPPAEAEVLELYEVDAAGAEPVDVLELETVDMLEPETLDLDLEAIEEPLDEQAVGAAAALEDDLVLDEVYDELYAGPVPDEPAEFVPESVALETEAPYDADAGYDLDAMTLPESIAEAELAVTDELESFLVGAEDAAAPAEPPAEADIAPLQPAATAGFDDWETGATDDEGWLAGEPPPPGFTEAEEAVTADGAALPPEEDQPWEAFGRALQDALSWAGLAAEETPPAEPGTLLGEAAPVESSFEPPPVFEYAEDWVTMPAAEAAERQPLPPPEILSEVGQPAAPDVVTAEAPTAGAAVDPVAADVADRLQSLADRLRTEGLAGLAEAIARGDRLEASLALFIAGYRAGRDD